MRLRPVLVVAGAALVLGLSVWWFTCPSNDVPDSDLPTGVTGRIVTLASVSNASGLAVVEHNGRRVAATVDEVDEWRGEGDPPPLIVLSSLETGEQVGGVLSIGMFGEVEALARRDGRWAFPYKTGAQRVVVRDGNNDINVIGPAVISQLRDASAALVEGPLYFEFEGLDSSEKGWEFVVAVVEPDARDTPRSTKLSFRFWCNFDGTEPTLSPADP